jgi:16S rRNA (uracil1498-N3)-methyltransferase
VRRFYARELPERGGEIALSDTEDRHARVLRLQVGDEVVLFDGSGGEAEGRVSHVDEAQIRCSLAARTRRAIDRPAIVLCQCLPKGAKLDEIVRACTEIGAIGIHFAISARSVPKLDDARASKKIERLSRIAREASRQSGRSDVPDLAPPAPLAEVLARAPGDAAKVVFAPGSGGALADAIGMDARAAWIAIGPEGGFAPEEVALARSRSFLPADLGPAVLRVETAAPVAVALALHCLGGLRPGR